VLDDVSCKLVVKGHQIDRHVYPMSGKVRAMFRRFVCCPFAVAVAHMQANDEPVRESLLFQILRKCFAEIEEIADHLLSQDDGDQ
jgi:hypothetical protein